MKNENGVIVPIDTNSKVTVTSIKKQEKHLIILDNIETNFYSATPIDFSRKIGSSPHHIMKLGPEKCDDDYSSDQLSMNVSR